MSEFEICHQMGWTHQFFLEEVTYEEYLKWFNYFDRQPPGWREDLRAFHIVNSSGNLKKGTKPEDMFPSIKQMKQNKVKPTEDDDRSAAMASFKASPFGAKFAEAMSKRSK